MNFRNYGNNSPLSLNIIVPCCKWITFMLMSILFQTTTQCYSIVSSVGSLSSTEKMISPRDKPACKCLHRRRNCKLRQQVVLFFCTCVHIEYISKPYLFFKKTNKPQFMLHFLFIPLAEMGKSLLSKILINTTLFCPKLFDLKSKK